MPERLTVLIADDNECDRYLCRRALECRGFQVMETSDAASTLEACRTSRPDGIVLDGCLLGQSGLDLCRRIREIEALESTPILIWSGIEEEEFKAAAIAAGADGILDKSFGADHVAPRLAALLARGSERQVSGSKTAVGKELCHE